MWYLRPLDRNSARQQIAIIDARDYIQPFETILEFLFLERF